MPNHTDYSTAHVDPRYLSVGKCPNCGYCPTCGRAHVPAYPQPWVQKPTWINPYPNIGGGTTTSKPGIYYSF